MSETVTQPTQQQQQETQDQAMADLESRLQGHVDSERGLSPEAKTKEEPKDKPQGKERDETGKFKAKEENAVQTERDDDENPAENTEAEEIDPFDDPKPAANTPKPHQPDKAIQKLQQDFGVMRREMQETISSLKEELKAARAAKPEAPATDKAAKLKALVDQGLLDPDVADTIAELVGTPADTSSLQAKIEQLEVERAIERESANWNAKFADVPKLLNQWKKACDIAVAVVKEKYPHLPENDPRFATLAYHIAHAKGEEYAAKYRKKPAPKKSVIDSDIDPEPSTKGARPATAGVARAPKTQNVELTEEQKYAAFEKRLSGLVDV